MNIFNTLWICHFIIFQTAQADLTAIPKLVSISVDTKHNEEVTVNLVPTETFLANENVPVWIPNPQRSKELQLMPDVMRELGPFTMYWDPANCATAVYYHKSREFDTIFGHHGMIRKLKYDPTTETMGQTQDTIFRATMRNHDEDRWSENINLIMPEDNEISVEKIRSRMEYPKEVYIETLVIVNYDIMEELEYNYAEVVSYVLSSFNMVDILYSKIEKPKIRINIAGIIIGTSHESFPIFRKCYQSSTSAEQMFEMDADCCIDAIERTLIHYRDLPFQSYDVAVFITGNELFKWLEGTSKAGHNERGKEQLFGLSQLSRVSRGYRRSTRDTRIAVVGNPDIYSIFPTAAHEMAHLFDVPHDGGSLKKEDGTCNAHLMRKDNSYCRRCLQFGGTTPEHLKKFFGTHQACIFRNEPGSLSNPQGPRLFWTEDEQCRCYGYVRAHTSTNCLPIHRLYSCGVDCSSRLMCVDRNDREHRTGIYMNGTPCDRQKIGSKVCWNSKCLPALTDPPSKSDN